MRRLYQAHGNDWWGLEESQAYLDQKLRKVNQGKHGTTRLRPTEEFEQKERSALVPLPVVPYEIEEYHKGKVRQDGHVRFRNKYYSVSEEYLGQEVVVIGNSTQVSVYHDGKLLELHSRVTDPTRSKSTKQQHKRPWEQTFEDNSVYRTKARKLGPWVEELVVSILGMGDGFVDTRKVWGILSLDKTYPAHIIDQACQTAHEHGSWSYQFVKRTAENLHALETVTQENPQLSLLQSNKPKFERQVGEYSQKVKLTLIKGAKHEQGNRETATADTKDVHCSQGNG